MKLLKLKQVISTSIACLMLASPFSANAVVSCGSDGDGYRCHYRSSVGTPPPMYHTLGDKVMNHGVGDYGSNRRYFWMDEALNYDIYHSPVSDAVSEWVYTTDSIGVTTSISIRETDTRSDAYFEVIANNSLASNVLGRTVHYIYKDRVDTTMTGVLTDNYGWARVFLNANKLGSNYNTIKATTAHEFGHAMGLSHQNCRYDSIMCQGLYGRTATRADKIDLQTINHLYG